MKLADSLLKSNSLLNGGFEMYNKIPASIRNHSIAYVYGGFDISIDGSHLITTAYGVIESYVLSTPFDFSTAVFDKNFSPPNTFSNAIEGASWNNDGTRFVILRRDTNNNYYYASEYTVSAPFDISTANNVYNLYLNQGAPVFGGKWNNDGTAFYVTDSYTNSLLKIDVYTPYTLSSYRTKQYKTDSGWLTDINFGRYGYYFSGYNSDGTKAYFQQKLSYSNGYLVIYDLATPYDVFSVINSSCQLIDFKPLAGYYQIGIILSPYNMTFVPKTTGTNKYYMFDDGVTLDDIINPLNYKTKDSESTDLALWSYHTVKNISYVQNNENNIFICGRYAPSSYYPFVARIDNSNGLANATITQSRNIGGNNQFAAGCNVSEDGTNLCMSVDINTNYPDLYSYTLTTPYDINTYSSYGSAKPSKPTLSFYFYNNGNNLISYGSGYISIASVSTPYSFYGYTEIQSVPFTTDVFNILFIDGYKLYLTNKYGGVEEYILTTPYDLTTIQPVATYIVDVDLFIKNDANKYLYFVSNSFTYDLKKAYVLLWNTQASNTCRIRRYLIE